MRRSMWKLAGCSRRPTSIIERSQSRHPIGTGLRGNVPAAAFLYREEPDGELLASDSLDTYQKLFGVTFEERDQVLRVLAKPVRKRSVSMGDDTPFAVYCRNAAALVMRLLPPAVRPSQVQSADRSAARGGGDVAGNLSGRRVQSVRGNPSYAPRLTANSPVLTEGRYRALLANPDGRYPHRIVDLNYPVDEGLQAAIERICAEAVTAAREG